MLSYPSSQSSREVVSTDCRPDWCWVGFSRKALQGNQAVYPRRPVNPALLIQQQDTNKTDQRDKYKKILKGALTNSISSTCSIFCIDTQVHRWHVLVIFLHLAAWLVDWIMHHKMERVFVNNSPLKIDSYSTLIPARCRTLPVVVVCGIVP